MAFNLKKVLKTLLLSSNQPLSVKDVQAAFQRFHETAPSQTDEDEPAAADAPEPGAPLAESAADLAAATGAVVGNPAVVTESPEVFAETADDPELYADVPSLVTAAQIREAMDAIAAELKSADDGLLLIEGNSGYRIVTHPRFARWVRILRSEPPPVKLSQSSIETLAIVAYRQPVTRVEIETIRGVSAEAGINKLLERELIYVVGRADLPGRPIQYGTTDNFLEFVGVKSIDELPASDVLSSRQIDEWLKNAMNPQTLSDTDVGLENEELPLEAAAAGESAAEGKDAS
ncbi:MAG TPA: SMC-Scp complex subunit ScpB [Opitutus sp.]|nr:SMC-Scp complex subunit ScpB [Opitutus sp.]